MDMNRNATDDVGRQLEELHHHYIGAVNMAVAAGQEARAEELAREYPDEALSLMTGQTADLVTGSGPAHRPRGRRGLPRQARRRSS
jgi:hypothetical protein